MRTLPDHDAWIDRFKAYRDFTETHGRLPENNKLGGPEDTLRTWLERQRTAEAAGDLDGSLAAILRSVKGSLDHGPAKPAASPRTVKEPPARQRPAGALRLEQFEKFCRTHGRLPRFSGESEEERAMWRYLNNKVRFQYRRNSLLPYELDRLSKIPGVFEARVYKKRVPAPAATDTARMLRIKGDLERTEELISFVTGNGRLPRAYGPDREPSLYNFLRKRIRSGYKAGTLDEVTIRRLSALDGVLVPSRRPHGGQAAA